MRLFRKRLTIGRMIIVVAVAGIIFGCLAWLVPSRDRHFHDAYLTRTPGFSSARPSSSPGQLKTANGTTRASSSSTRASKKSTKCGNESRDDPRGKTGDNHGATPDSEKDCGVPAVIDRIVESPGINRPQQAGSGGRTYRGQARAWLG
jgi:hypothetical protein